MKLSHLLVLSTALVFTGAIAQQAVAPANPEAVPVVAVDTGTVKPGDPKAGQAKAGACAACHGVDGNAAIALYPKLACQHEQYIWRQLKMYKTGERNNAIMLGLAAVLTEQDMRDIGAYFSQQKVIAGLADETVIAQGPNAGKKFYEVGEKIYRSGNATNDVPACMACHGPAGAGMPGPTYPALGGQHADYTSLRLNEFRAGTVWGKDKNANVIMSQAAKGLSDEDIQGLATYLQGLHKAGKPTAK